jgi:hypothetical protein
MSALCVGGIWVTFFMTAATLEHPTSYRQFLYIAGEPNYKEASPYPFRPAERYPLEDPFRDTRFPAGSTLELLNEDGRGFTVTSWQGEPFTFEKYFSAPGWSQYETIPHRVMTVPWDVQKDRPLCLSDPLNPFHRYFLWLTNGRLFLLWGVYLGAVLLAAIRRREVLGLLSILLILAVVVPRHAAAANMLSDSQCGPRASLPDFRTSNGRIRPVPDYRIVAPYGDAGGYRQIAETQILALLGLGIAHALLALLVIPAVKGAHYMLVPHPAERFVRSTGSDAGRGLWVDYDGLAGKLGAGDPRRPPPEFVSENQTQRVQKMAKRFRAERELAEEAVRYGRAGAAERKEKKP